VAENLPTIYLHLGTAVVRDFIPRNRTLMATTLPTHLWLSVSPVPSLTEMKNLQGHLEV